MTNLEYTERYHDLLGLVSTRSLARYYDDDANRLGFVVDVGDAEDKFGIEEFRSYPYKVLDTLNDRLKEDGLATIKYVGNEKSLVSYIAHFGSREYQNTHEVLLLTDYSAVSDYLDKAKRQKELDDYAEDIDQQAFAQGRESSRGGK